eukprot:g19518.t1
MFADQKHSGIDRYPTDAASAWALVSTNLLLTGQPLLALPPPRGYQDWVFSLSPPACASPKTAFRLLALAASCLRGDKNVLPKALLCLEAVEQLPLFLRSCGDLLFRDWNLEGAWAATATSDAAALVILGPAYAPNRTSDAPGLLAMERPSWPALLRSEALHSGEVAKSLHAAVERLLLGGESAEESFLLGGQKRVSQCLQLLDRQELSPCRCLSEPCLLLLIFLLRAEPGWLRDCDLFKIQPLLVRLARSTSRTPGSQRLLLLRLAEELLFLEWCSECHRVVLRQLLAERHVWDRATQELRELRERTHTEVPSDASQGDDVVMSEGSDEDMDLMSLQRRAAERRRAEGSRLPIFASNLECLGALHRAASQRLCACLAVPGQN